MRRRLQDAVLDEAAARDAVGPGEEVAVDAGRGRALYGPPLHRRHPLPADHRTVGKDGLQLVQRAVGLRGGEDVQAHRAEAGELKPLLVGDAGHQDLHRPRGGRGENACKQAANDGPTHHDPRLRLPKRTGPYRIRTGSPPSDTCRLLARDHAAPEPTLLLARLARWSPRSRFEVSSESSRAAFVPWRASISRLPPERFTASSV